MADLERRKLFSQVLEQVKGALPEPQLDPHLRPPGALPEAQFLAACTRCDACVQACPEQAIFRFTASAGELLVDTPVLIPENRACLMCEGFPCVKACEDDALKMPEGPLWNLGTVRIDEGKCIAFMGPECGACAGLCPHDAKALRLERWRPQVDPQACVGCGLCIGACPTDPPAIVFEPRE